jgi:tetratricopeptide (TPR) repeat protein
VWLRLGWDWIRDHPLDFLLLEVRKVWLLLQEQEVTHLESFGFHRGRLSSMRLFVVGFSWILPLAALGLWRAQRERLRGAGILAGFVTALLLPNLIFFVTSRYRLAAVPGLALLAGLGAVTLIAWLRAEAWRKLALAAVPLVALFAVARSAGAPSTGEFAWQNAQMAHRFAVLGDLDAAIGSQEEAVRLLPDDARPRVELARYRSERGAPGDFEHAESLLREAVPRLPDRPDVPFLLGVVLVRQGRIDEARAAWQRALEIDPDYEPARARLRQGAPR